MSKHKRPLQRMRSIANGIVARLYPACHRISIAGSIRRKEPEVGDIEIVAVPILLTNLLGEPTGVSEVDHQLNDWPIAFTKNGQKYKQFSWHAFSGEVYQVDLFLQPDPATWGLNYLIRTGPAAFSKRMVTSQAEGGLRPDDLSVRDARVWRNGAALETPEERDVFTLWKMDYIEPEQRR